MPHIHELIDWCVGVYIVHNNRVLIRRHDKYPIWVHVGGHIELDEDPIAAAVRECCEEVGLDINIFDADGEPDTEPEPNVRYLPRPAHMNIHYVGDSAHQHIDLIYYATSETDDVTPEKATDTWLWLTRDELDAHNDIRPRIKAYAHGALDALATGAE